MLPSPRADRYGNQDRAIGAAAGSDPIAAGAADQTLESIGGNDTLVGSTAFGDTFLRSSIDLAGDLIEGFGGGGAIDITDMGSGGVQPYFIQHLNRSAHSYRWHGGTQLVLGGWTGAQIIDFLNTARRTLTNAILRLGGRDDDRHAQRVVRRCKALFASNRLA